MHENRDWLYGFREDALLGGHFPSMLTAHVYPLAIGSWQYVLKPKRFCSGVSPVQ